MTSTDNHTIVIHRPILRVVVEGPAGDLVEYTVQTDNRDAVRFDVLRAQRNWPGGDSAPMLWLTVQAWSALRRAKVGPVSELKVEAFLEACVDVEAVDEQGNPVTDPGQGVTAGPTPPGPGPD